GPTRLGIFGYVGKERGALERINTTTWFGPDLIWDIGEKVQLNLQYLDRRDDDPFFLGPGSPEIVTRGGFAELQVFPQGQDGRFALSFLYNKVDSD
ncbi:hypothetical protein LZP69_16215, partial [Shewanella sp. AS1]|uniref:hypothetical protein n=1 Tax=Shewanella sp. AS1 TaxID=2907626 RepID=UPI001F48F9AB